jgi:hypothetical protein
MVLVGGIMYPWFTNQGGFEGLCLEGVPSHIKKNYLLYGLTYIEGKHKLLSLLVLRLLLCSSSRSFGEY